MSPTSIFAPVSTPADSIFELSLFVLAVTAAIFVVVFGLLVYAVVRFRRRRDDDGSDGLPPDRVQRDDPLLVLAVGGAVV